MCIPKDSREGSPMMKRLPVFIASVILLLAVNAHAQAGEADAILGNWLTEGGKAIIEIYRCGERYCGKIVWLKEPKDPNGTDKLDAKNPDPSERKRKIIGLNLVWDFTYDGDNKWVEGGIYDPDNGKTYSCKMNLDGDRLKVRGYIGVSLFGRTTVWTRKQ
jgi:uncharacterized protein (DUF2147 family)